MVPRPVGLMKIVFIAGCLLLGLMLANALGLSISAVAWGLAFAFLLYLGIFGPSDYCSESLALLSLATILVSCFLYGPLDNTSFTMFLYAAPAPYAYAYRRLSSKCVSGLAIVASIPIALRGEPRLILIGHMVEISAVIVSWIIAGEAILRLERERDRFRHASLTDPLTGLWTLGHAMDLAKSALKAQAGMAVLFIDMDGFKQFNDTFGHLSGNRVLTQFAEALREESAQISPGSIVGRLGGDEFVVAIPGLSGAAAEEARRHLSEKLAGKMFLPDPEFTPVGLRFSIGLASSSAGAPLGVERLMHLADIDMYREKYGAPEPLELPELDEGDLPMEYRRYLRHLAETDIYTYAHSQHASQTATELAMELGLPEEDIEALGMAGWLHDIGKILIPVAILRKPADLLPEEYDAVKGHVVDTLNLIDHLGLPPKVIAAIRSHHERWDGWGYPLHLIGNETPLEGRILQVADAFSAMTLKRVYRQRTSVADAVAEIGRNAGSQFDPHIARTFVAMWERKGNRTLQDESPLGGQASPVTHPWTRQQNLNT